MDPSLFFGGVIFRQGPPGPEGDEGPEGEKGERGKVIIVPDES